MFISKNAMRFLPCGRAILYGIGTTILCGQAAYAAVSEPLEIPIIYMEKKAEHPPRLSNFENIPEDQGVQGARLALKDNQTTGRFLKHDYKLSEIVVGADEDIIEEARKVLGNGSNIVVLNMPAADILALADLPEAADDLLINAGSYDVELRNEQCRYNVLHTLPSRDMLSDALVQFLVKRRWTNMMLVTGLYETDKALGEAFRKSANKFGVKIVEDKPWIEDADIRRNAMQEIPLFTQNSNHDVIVVADEEDQFGSFFEYNTWQPRPVMGSAGLMTLGWSPAMEQWAAIQLQDRFIGGANRPMNAVDYASWLAVRSIGETVTRNKTNDVADIRKYMLSDEFTLDGFKGSRLSFRQWNGQLRQPIALATERALVTLAPIEGFLHKNTELDTLGLDQPETACKVME